MSDELSSQLAEEDHRGSQSDLLHLYEIQILKEYIISSEKTC